MDKLLSVENISKAGVVGLLLLILITGSTHVWVWGSDYNIMVADRDEWKRTALEGLKTSREVSAVRLPIMASAQPNKELTPAEVKEQLQVIHNMNEVNPE